MTLSSNLLSSRKVLVLIGVAVAAGAIAVGLLSTGGQSPTPAGAADHLDAPNLSPPGGDSRTDITDLYVFQSPRGPDYTVLAMNVNALSPAGQQATFASNVPKVDRDERVKYLFRIDNDADSRHDVTLGVTFGEPDKNGQQSMVVRRNGDVIYRDKTSAFGKIRRGSQNDVKAFAGTRDDPFFFDLNGFVNILDFGGESLATCSGVTPDGFAGVNVASIVLEVPTSMLADGGDSMIGVWAVTKLGGNNVDRAGRPAVSTVFVPNNPIPPDDMGASAKTLYNTSAPKNDVANFTGEVTNTLATLFSLNDAGGALGGTDDPSDDAAQIAGLAGVLLPDILTFDTANASGFLNGRRLTDDVIDAELALITEGLVTTDCVNGNDVPFKQKFPYMADPHA